MMCNELNNVRVIFTNSELQAHNAKSYPLQRLLSPRPKSSAGPKESSGRNIVPPQQPPHGSKGGQSLSWDSNSVPPRIPLPPQ